MQPEIPIHRSITTVLLVVLLGFVLLFLYLDSQSPNIWAEASVALVMEIATSVGLVYVAFAEGFVASQLGAGHKREIAFYLLLAALSIGCALDFALTKNASLMRIALIVSPHAFLFGFAQIRLSQHLGRHPALRTSLMTCGVIEVCMGIGLIVVSRISNPLAVRFVAYVAAVTAIQLIGLLVYTSGQRKPGLMSKPA